MSAAPPTGETHLLADDPDRALFEQARQGDFRAFTELVTRYQQRVYGLAYRMLNSVHDAEDVVQQTFLSAIEHLRDFRGDGAVAGWFLRIAANHALKTLRKKRGLPLVAPPAADSDTDSYADVPHPDFVAPWREDPADLAQQRETRQFIDRALAELDDKYRTIFVLRDIEGLSVRETAEVLNLSEANVKVRLLRARLALREVLTRTLGDESARLYPDHNHG